MPSRVTDEVNLDTRIERPIKRIYSVDLPSPGNDRRMIFYVDQPLTITWVQVLVEGSTPSVTWNIEYSKDTSSFTPLFTSNQTTTTSTGESYYPDSRKVPRGFNLWLNLASQSGTVDHFDITVGYVQ